MEELVQEIVSKVGGQERVHRVERKEQEEQEEQEQKEQEEQEEQEHDKQEEQEEQEQDIAVGRRRQWDCYTQVQCSLVYSLHPSRFRSPIYPRTSQLIE